MTDERIKKINELAKKSRTAEGLTDEEKILQKKLREEYIASFRGNLKGQLDNITLVDEKGNKTKLAPKNK